MKKMTLGHRFSRRFAAGLSVAALAVGMCPALAYAANNAEEATDDLFWQVANSLSDDSTYAYDYLDGQTDAGASTMATLPSKLDLREYGVVTPVKFQNPWGTCWAFGITAAAETSILSELGTTYEATGLDLSEHHLSWFAKNHLVDDSSQNGEGIWYASSDKGASMSGGMPYYGAYTYAAGMGVVNENDCPYNGLNLWIETKQGKVKTDTTMTYEQAIAAGYKPSEIRCYSSIDDWSLPESDRFQQLYALEESNVLPSTTPYYDEKAGKYQLDEAGINAVKSELNAGRAVNVAYMADNSSPNQADPSATTSRYMNVDTWAQFTWSTTKSLVGANHSVTIVGYDDDYPASNFTNEKIAKWDSGHHVVYQLTEAYLAAHAGEVPEAYQGELPNDAKTGDPYYVNAAGETVAVDTDTDCSVVYEYTGEEAKKLSTPDGNGAWIVKNSWGSATQAFPNSNCGKGWGYNGEGYFYLSYYDMSACCCETFDFAVSEEEQSGYDYSLCYEYDYMPSYSTMASTTLDTVHMANVFENSEASKIYNVSCQTSTPGTQVKYEVYLLDKDAENPMDGKLVATAEETYTYGGFHRKDLDTPIVMAAGQKFSVVVTETIDVGERLQYSLNFNSAENKISAEIHNYSSWVQGVVNKGESYLGVEKNGTMQWTDWSVFTSMLQTVNYESSEEYDFDNFCIKAYGQPIDDVTDIFTDVEAGQWYSTSVQRVYGLGLMTGYKDAQGNLTGLFGTHDTLTRAQAVAVLYNQAGKGATVEGGKFSDVASGSWYADAVNWAAEQGIVSGYDDGRFGPEDQVTREQLAAMLYAMAQKGLISAPTTYEENALATFPDAGSVSSWATVSMKWAVSQGVISGTNRDGSRYLDPAAASERCVMAAMVSNILG